MYETKLFRKEDLNLEPVNKQEIVHMNEFENWNDEELRVELERLQAIH